MIALCTAMTMHHLRTIRITKHMAATMDDLTSLTCTDTMMDGDETDIDCGGSCAPCRSGQRCYNDIDCHSRMVCKRGICQTFANALRTHLPTSSPSAAPTGIPPHWAWTTAPTSAPTNTPAPTPLGCLTTLENACGRYQHNIATTACITCLDEIAPAIKSGCSKEGLQRFCLATAELSFKEKTWRHNFDPFKALNPERVIQHQHPKTKPNTDDDGNDDFKPATAATCSSFLARHCPNNKGIVCERCIGSITELVLRLNGCATTTVLSSYCIAPLR